MLKLKNVLITLVIMTICLGIFACAKKETKIDAVSFVKDFYTEYLKADLDASKRNAAISKYVGTVMAQEMEYRSRHANADMYVMSQDSTGYLDNLKVVAGDSDGWANVTFGGTNTVKCHVVTKDGKTYIDTIDNYGDNQQITKYGNKEMTDEIKKALESESAHFKEMDEQGYID